MKLQRVGEKLMRVLRFFWRLIIHPPIIAEDDEYIGDGFVTDSGNSGRISYRLGHG